MLDTLSKVASLITVLLSIVTSVLAIWIKVGQDNLDLRQKEAETQQKMIKGKVDQLQLLESLAKTHSNIWPSLLPIIEGSSTPGAALTLAMSFPEGGYAAAKFVIAGAHTLKGAREMGAINQTSALLDSLNTRITSQKLESKAREQDFKNLEAEAIKHLQIRNIRISPDLIKIKSGNDLIREELKKAGGPLFSKSDLKDLCSQGIQLLQQAQTEEYRKLVPPIFLRVIGDAQKDVEEVFSKLDAADDKDLNTLAIRLNEIYSDVSPTIKRTVAGSDKLIASFEEFIKVARGCLSKLDSGSRLLPQDLIGLSRAYNAAIQAATSRGDAEQVQEYKDLSNFINYVIISMNIKS